jgi:PAS domain S-box-containing protein
MINQDQEIFNILLESVSEAVIIINEEHRILEVNRVAESIFGYKKKELIDQSLNLLIPNDFHKVHRGYVEDFIKKKQTPKNG